ncbi:MAG: hypothetical protein GWO00_15635 [Gemmatimonadetes bacterium]|nr:hypothetical protein [Gemmatimonadota bacterium]NIP78731.1 hypothetical protein [Gemmatimonadota bacterium]NIR79741.1 hypothetical protein [Gemmatimonadota bacterium]NIU32260.1 hypothetical protein [Gemmatimonadota bacterium]NIU36801.1 hypothetical protein [Gemmatimonadota bacterium]
MNANRWILGVTALALFASAPAHGQERSRPGPEVEDREVIRQRIRERFAARVQEELDLTDEEARELRETVERFDERRRELMRAEAAARIRRRSAVALERVDPEGEAISDEGARSSLDAMVDLREREVALLGEEIDALLEVVPPSKVLRFFHMRQRLVERVRRTRHPGGGRGGPPRGERPPPR